jgi:site-specific recombinase XerD
MRMKSSASFSYHVTKFFGEYLPMHLGASKNTVSSYRDTFVQLIDYLKDHCGIKAEKAAISDITYAEIEGFLSYIEELRNIGIATRNLRLAAIHSFFKYVQRHELECFGQCTAVLGIPFKKKAKTTMAYLSIDEIEMLLSLPDTNTKKGIRNLAILSTLYETGARVQEVIDLSPTWVRLESNPCIELHGKGQKVRLVPIGAGLATILAKYFKTFNTTVFQETVFQNNQGKKLSRAGIQYIVDKYVSLSCRSHPELRSKTVTSHTFRHSKAMHLLEAGVNLIYIRDFLGHSSVTTTEVYARTNPELKRKYIEQNALSLDMGGKYQDDEKQDLLDWLKNSL